MFVCIAAHFKSSKNLYTGRLQVRERLTFVIRHNVTINIMMTLALNVSGLKERMSLVQPRHFVDVQNPEHVQFDSHERSSHAGAEARWRRALFYSCAFFESSRLHRPIIGAECSLGMLSLECCCLTKLLSFLCGGNRIRACGSRRAADCSYCLPSIACGTHRQTAAQGDWCSENNRNRNTDGASKEMVKFISGGLTFTV